MLTIHSSGVKILELCSSDYFTFELCTVYHYEWVFQHIINLPISSANPPTGTLQVPVTNCNRRARFSLSIERTNCNIQRYICNSSSI